jgi:hypothetical protein
MKRLILLFLSSTLGLLVHGQIPVFHWASNFGGSGVNIGYGIVNDASGDVYTTGSFSGIVDFDPGVGVYTLSASGVSDVFVSKLTSSGAFVWAVKLGGNGIEVGNAIALDTLGNVFTTGFFTGTADFDPSPATFNLVSAGNEDVFVCKLDAGGALVWAKRMGGGSSEIGQGVAVDAAGNVHTTGFFQGAGDYDPGAAVFNLAPSGGADVFLSKLDAAGNFIWAKRLGGSGTGTGRAISVDADGNVYSGGAFSGLVDFDPGPGVNTINSAGGTDVFISKLNASGNFIWARHMGGIYSDYCSSIALDATGNVYSTGGFQFTADFDPGPSSYTFEAAGAGANDIFISKLDAAGNFVWAKQIGGINDDIGHAIKIDIGGNVYSTGYFNGTVDFDPGPGVFTLTSSGADDFYISKLNSSGNFIWTLKSGGTDSDVSRGITVDIAGNVFTTGYFSGTADFDPGPGTYTLNSPGNTDVFIQKLCALPSAPVNATPGGNQGVCTGQSATLSAVSSGSVVWYGSPTGTNVLGTGTNYITPPLGTGNYTYYAEAYTCYASPVRTPITVTVSPEPIFSASTNVLLLCVGETATLSVTGLTSATWTPGGIGTSIVVSPSVSTTYTVQGANGGCTVSAVINQPVSECTGLEDLRDLDSYLQVFPNPAADELYLQNSGPSNFKLILYDACGREVRHSEVLPFSNHQLRTEGLEDGIYYLRAISPESSIKNFKVLVLANP